MEGNQGDTSEFMGSDGILYRGNSRRITGDDHENSKTGHRDDQENSYGIIRNDHMGIVGNDCKEIIKDDLLGHYEIYVMSKELKGELGVALINTGLQVS
jgi:hypothetical protein